MMTVDSVELFTLYVIPWGRFSVSDGKSLDCGFWVVKLEKLLKILLSIEFRNRVENFQWIS